MSNRPNDDFNDDFNFDDDFGSDSRDDLSDDLSPDFGDESSDELPDLGDEELPEERETGGGPSRTFIIIAAIMIVLFVVGLIALVIIASGPRPLDPLELTATEITIRNMTSIAQATLDAEEVIAFSGTQTAIALIPTETPTNTPRPTVTPTFTPTDAPTLDATLLAGTAFAEGTQAALFATETAIAQQSATVPGLSLPDVQATASALAIAFGATPTPDVTLGAGGGIVPTQEGAASGGTTGALPETGFFDDIASGGRNGVGLIVLMGFGLVGVIFISRRLRTANEK